MTTAESIAARLAADLAVARKVWALIEADPVLQWTKPLTLKRQFALRRDQFLAVASDNPTSVLVTEHGQPERELKVDLEDEPSIHTPDTEGSLSSPKEPSASTACEAFARGRAWLQQVNALASHRREIDPNRWLRAKTSDGLEWAPSAKHGKLAAVLLNRGTKRKTFYCESEPSVTVVTATPTPPPPEQSTLLEPEQSTLPEPEQISTALATEQEATSEEDDLEEMIDPPPMSAAVALATLESQLEEDEEDDDDDDDSALLVAPPQQQQRPFQQAFGAPEPSSLGSGQKAIHGTKLTPPNMLTGLYLQALASKVKPGTKRTTLALAPKGATIASLQQELPGATFLIETTWKGFGGPSVGQCSQAEQACPVAAASRCYGQGAPFGLALGLSHCCDLPELEEVDEQGQMHEFKSLDEVQDALEEMSSGAAAQAVSVLVHTDAKVASADHKITQVLAPTRGGFGGSYKLEHAVIQAAYVAALAMAVIAMGKSQGSGVVVVPVIGQDAAAAMGLLWGALLQNRMQGLDVRVVTTTSNQRKEAQETVKAWNV